MSELKNYIVTVPIAGAIFIPIKAESEEEAIGRSWFVDDEDCEIELERYSEIVSGNVRHNRYNTIEVEEE